jgi:hypothetical protein
MAKTVNEKSNAVLTLEFISDTGVPVVPDSFTYRIDTADGEVVRVSTPVVPTLTTYDIALTTADNTVINNTLDTEQHVVTVVWQYGANTKQGTAQFIYSVKNLNYVL